LSPHVIPTPFKTLSTNNVWDKIPHVSGNPPMYGLMHITTNKKEKLL
jgi:hypothetical protein